MKMDIGGIKTLAIPSKILEENDLTTPIMYAKARMVPKICFTINFLY